MRIFAWLLLLAVVCAGLYLNQVGLPGFIKRPLLDQLRQRGIELEFTRLRLLGHAGIVAENVRLSPVQTAASLKLSARQAELDLNWRALLRGRLQVDALELRNGHFAWPVASPRGIPAATPDRTTAPIPQGESNAPPRTLALEDIQTRLRFLPDDEWALEDFRARFAGARLFLAGNITHATAIRDWHFLRLPEEDAARRAAPGTARRRLRLFAEAIERMAFATPPDLRLFITGDARTPQTFTLRLTATAPEAETPWGTVSGGIVNARLFAATASSPSRAELSLAAAEARTPWADASQLALELKLDSVAGQPNLVDGDLTLRAASARTRWATATNAEFTAQWVHALTNPIPLSGRGELHAARASTKWAGGRNVRLVASLATATNPPSGDAGWAWWTNLLPYQLTWEAGLDGLETEKLVAEKVVCAGGWLAPQLTVTNLHVAFRRGALDARARLDVPTRAASAELTSSFDLGELGPLLTEEARRWLDRCSWAELPRLHGSAAVILPAWTNRQPDWRGEVLPTLGLAGEFAVTNVAYRGVAADWARSHVTFTNLLWRLPDLELGRPDGQLQAVHQADLGTQEYYWRVHSTLDPQVLRPLLSTNEQRGLDFFVLTMPPVIDAEVWGQSHAPERVGVRGHVALTNFTFRDTPVSAFTSGLAYSNQLLEAFEPRVWRGTQHLRAAGVAVDFTAQRVHFTNVFSTEDPMTVTRAIGPKTARAIEPYHFAAPPVVHLEGSVPMRGNAGADLRVEVSGGPFNWWKFNVPQIAGTVHWQDDLVTLTNVTAAFYGGEARGWGVFDAAPGNGTDCRFDLTATNVQLHALMADLSTRTNRLEGTLDAALTITRANSADWRSWNGYGQARLRDGWIWAIPVFGVLSGPLDGILPGLGSSRVTSGSAQFVLTNGVIFSDDLEWRAPAMRLQYAGAADLQGQVNATVQAELLRDTWLVGRIVSLALWPVSKILEFKVTGTLDQPKAEPLYIPKLLTVPLRPWQTLRELFSGSPGETNGPPGQPRP